MPTATALDFLYRADLGVFTVRWPTTEDTATTRAEYEALLLVPEARQSPRWLLDVRRRPHRGAVAPDWFNGTWLPRAVALVNGPLRLAFLVAPARAEELRPDAPQPELLPPAARPALPYDMQIFTDEGAAVRWLLA